MSLKHHYIAEYVPSDLDGLPLSPLDRAATDSGVGSLWEDLMVDGFCSAYLKSIDSGISTRAVPSHQSVPTDDVNVQAETDVERCDDHDALTEV